MKPKKPSPFAKKKGLPLKKVIAHNNPIKTSFLKEDLDFPLVLQPTSSDVDIFAWVKEQRKWLEEKLAKHGAILFRGFPIDNHDAFISLVKAFCPGLYGKYGDLPASGKENVYKVTPYPEDKQILFHSEASHTHTWPMKQFFYCHIPAAEGGRTPIVDCRTIYKKLKEKHPDWLKDFEERKLQYLRNFIQGVDVSWQDFFKTEDRSVVEAHCRENDIHFEWKRENDLMMYHESQAVAKHPYSGEDLFFNQIQLHHVAHLDAPVREAFAKTYNDREFPRNVFFGDGGTISDEIALTIEKIYWENSASFLWEKGDILAVDNMLISHARDTFKEPRQMYVAMGDMMTLEKLEELNKSRDE